MKCAYCGKNNRPGALVCKRCGIALPLAKPSDAPSPVQLVKVDESTESKTESGTGSIETGSVKKPGKKAAFIGTAVILAVLAAAALAIVIAVNSGSIILPSKNSYSVFDNSVFFGGEPFSPDASAVKSAVTDLDGSNAAVLTSDASLYSCVNGINTLIAKNVKGYSISAEGGCIVYSDESGLLWSFDCSAEAGAPVCISNDAVKPGFSVSPDGKTVLYSSEADSKLYANTNGKIREIGDGLVPIAVSNGAKHVYSYSPNDNSIYYTNSRGKTSFIRSNTAPEIFLNSRHDELVFSTYSGNGIVQTMISKAGGEAVEICNSNDVVRPVLPVSGVTIHDDSDPFDIVTCPFKSFDGKLFSGSKLVLYSSSKGAEVLEPNSIGSAAASDNYSTVFYTSEGALLKRVLSGAETAERVADECAAFTLSSNGRIVWYSDLGGVLHCMIGSIDKTIAVGVERFTAISSGRSAAFICSGSLYVNKGGSPTGTYPCEGADAADIYADASVLYYLSESEGWKVISELGKRIDLSK